MKKTTHAMMHTIMVFACLTGIIMFYGCRNAHIGNAFLEKPPSTDSNIDTVFSRAKYAKQFLWGAYRTLPYGLYGGNYDATLMQDDPLADITDIGVSEGVNEGALIYYSGSYDASTENGTETKFDFYNSGTWLGIRRAWQFIDNVDRVPDMDAQTKKRLKAEARLIIAIHYVELFRNYGGMMWVGHAYTPNEDLQNPRMTAMATLDSTLMLINKAIPDLPFTLKHPKENSGRLTQAAAMGEKVRLFLFAASPLFNSDQPFMQGEAADKKLVWYGKEHPELWDSVATTAKKLIDKNQQEGTPYHLAAASTNDKAGYRKAFQHGYFDRDSPEILISTRAAYRNPTWPSFLVNRGSINVTNNYVRMFPMADGTPIDKSSSYDPDNPYNDRDPRLYESVTVNGDKFQGRTAELYFGGRERNNKSDKRSYTGYWQRKFVLDINTAQRSIIQFPYLRLPEIYLSYAEALDQKNGGPNKTACHYVDLVRDRVGLDNIGGSLSGCENMSKKDFRIAVLQERARELSYEDVRWFDLIRWKMKNIFTEPLYGLNICKEGESDPKLCGKTGYGTKTYLHERFKLTPPRSWAINFSPKWYLSAFPKNEILKGYGVIQNPGW
jgi:hypothetical protein